MIGQKNIKFFDKVSAPGESEYYFNVKADIIAVEISGSFSAATVAFEGQTDIQKDPISNDPSTWTWVPIAGVNLSDYTYTAKPAAAGIYEVPIEGLQRFRVRVESVTGGDISVFGRAVSEV